MTPLAQRSSLPRMIDFSYPSNRYAAGGLLLTAALAKLLGRSAEQSLGVGLAGFAAWATARELDPAFPESAQAALPLAAAAAFVSGSPHPLASFSVLSALRALAAPVGYPPSPRDLWVLAAQSVMTGLLGEQVAAALPGAALGLSALQGDQFSSPASSALMAAAALWPSSPQPQNALSGLICLAALGTFGVLERSEAVSCPCDHGSAAVSSQRVQKARQLALGSLAACLLLKQTRSFTPLAAAVLSVGWRRGLAR